MHTSRVVAEVRKHNLLTTLQFKDLDRLRRGLAAVGRKGADPSDAAIARKLGKVAAFRTAARNAELRQLARDGRSSAMLDHPMVHELLADPRVRAILGAAPAPASPEASDRRPDVGRVEGPAEEIDPGIDE